MELRMNPTIAFRYTIASLFLALSSPGIQAQDTLFYGNGEKIIGQVEEVGVDLVRYRTTSGGSPVLIVAEKRDLLRLKLAGGQEFVFNNVSTDVPATAAFMGRTQAISLDVIAPALNHITIGYEHLLGLRSSLVVKAGYIGLWKKERNGETLDKQGWMVKIGPKFIMPPATKRYPSARDKHPLTGWYLKPELMFSYWTDNLVSYGFYDPSTRTTNKIFYSSAVLNLVIGRQVLLGERFIFDLYGGLGYGTSWRNGIASGYDSGGYSSREEYSFSHAFFSSGNPLCASGGMLFGYAF